jgi:hypothetical protein
VDIRHSFIYGVKSPDGGIVPRIFIQTLKGFVAIDPRDLDVQLSWDGPHPLKPWQIELGISSGLDIPRSDIECLWSQRPLNEATVDYLNDVNVWMFANTTWSGSALRIDHDSSGNFSSAEVVINVPNRYQLMALLRWLDMPSHLITKATGIERL